MAKKEFPEFKQELKGVSKLMQGLPKVAGSIAVEHSMKNFQTESWNGQTRNPWKPRKGDSKKKKGRRALLVKSGHLKGDINYETRGGDVAIGTNVKYAKTHNEGTKAGRGKGFIMPKRQFMGPSPEIDKNIDKYLDDALDKIFG